MARRQNTSINTAKMGCRFCGCRMNEVRETEIHEVTYHGKKRTIVKRRRVCRHCGLSFNTVETYEDESNTNLPEDVQPFQPAPPPKPGVYCPIPKAGPQLEDLDPNDSKPPKTDKSRGRPLPPEKPQASRTKKRKA